MLGKYVPQDIEASSPHYIRPFCLTESQSEGDGRKKKKSEKTRELFGFSSLGVQQGSAHTALLEMCALW